MDSELEKVYLQQIEALISAHNVILFMKGSEDNPKCGFSSAAVKVLKGLGIKNCHCVDVLQDEMIRSALKKYSNWPTIPQLFVKKEFVGGCDIILDLYQSGDLAKKLKDHI